MNIEFYKVGMTNNNGYEVGKLCTASLLMTFFKEDFAERNGSH
jgi:hypothetical protein